MKDSISLNQFKNKYCDTLKTNEDGTPFVALPFRDYEHLGFFKANIIKAVELIAEHRLYQVNEKGEEAVCITKSLTHILKSLSMETEFEGLTVLNKNE